MKDPTRLRAYGAEVSPDVRELLKGEKGTRSMTSEERSQSAARVARLSALPAPRGVLTVFSGAGGMAGIGAICAALVLGLFARGKAGSEQATVVTAEPRLPADQCPDDQKRCDHIFTYKAGSETSVEVLGDFKLSGWQYGVYLVKQGTEWSASVAIPYNKKVQYKFRLNHDDSEWVIDPANPDRVPDGVDSDDNSVLAPRSCDSPPVCEPASP